MSLLARHKKPGGFENLVHFLETTPLEKREKLMEAMQAEDAEFMKRVGDSLLLFNDFKKVRLEILMEITYELGENIRILALALYKWDDTELVEHFKKALAPKQMAAFKEAEGELDKVTKSQREGAQLKLVETARKIDLARNYRIKPYQTEQTQAT